MKKILAIVTASVLLGSCTKLDEQLQGTMTFEDAQKLTDVSALLKAAYDRLRNPYQDQSRVWAAMEHTTDEVIGPTRGGDWDDNGVWRVLHNHRWDADHAFLQATFDELLQAQYTATSVLAYNPTPSQAAQARFLRAFVNFTVVDGWNQLPTREVGEPALGPAKVLTTSEALEFIIKELTEIIPTLPDGPAHIANKDAARTLLMKVYLNRGTFANRQSPTFPAADMQQVITLADQIAASPRNYAFNANFYDNFAPKNNTLSRENIWTAENIGGVEAGNVRSRYFCTLHYNQNPSGWNGFTTLSDFYNKFEAADKRRGDAYTGVTDRTGLRVGFLVGQQFDQNGTALQDRTGAPLSFTPGVRLLETGANLEVTGIRVVKYPPDYVSGDNVDNDYVYFRYSDVLLMKAEAQLRTNNAGGALTIVNQIRAARGASNLLSINLDQLLDERGRELYWESHRRTDMIRFGKFLLAYSEKPASGPERLLFPIPNQQLAVNPNLKQNPGY